MKKKHPNKKYEIKKEVREDELQEDDLILLPGSGLSQRTGFTQHDPDRAEHEGETLKNSLRTIVRVASDLNKRLDNQDHFPEWVSEKVGAIKSMMTSVMQYLASEQEAGHGLAEHEMADTRTSMNRTGDEITSEHDDAYATLKRIAPRIYRYIRNEAPIPIDPIQTLQAFRMTRGNEGQLLSMFKSQIAADTEEQYGKDHPSLAESMRQFLNNLLNESTGGVIAGGGVGEGINESDVEDRLLAIAKKYPIRSGKLYTGTRVPPGFWDLLSAGTYIETKLGITNHIAARRKALQNLEKDIRYYNPYLGGHSIEQLQAIRSQIHPDEVGEAADPIAKRVTTGSDMKESKVDELSEIKRLSGVGEGKKADRMVKHVEKSEEKAGKSKKEAENIAWATANKRGYLDNKNHIKGK